MKIGIPKEVKIREGRVALLPYACSELISQGHEVLLEAEAGLLSGYKDELYEQCGARIIRNAKSLYQQAELIVKVKEPIESEYEYLKPEHIIFSYLHLAANPTLAAYLKQLGLQAIAFETVEVQGQLPLLAPMSQIAGKVAAQVGTNYLHSARGGKGVLLGGVAGTERGRVVVMGAGQAGYSAALVLAALGANVTVFDKISAKLDTIRTLGPNVTGLYPYPGAVEEAILSADLVIGAVLIPGAKAPVVVSSAMVKQMSKGSVIVDISVDQGGCVETTRPTSYDDPIYFQHEVLHFAVTNMPGAVPRTASQALSMVLLPYVLEIASGDWQKIESLKLGLNVSNGEYIHPALKTGLA